MSDQTPDLLAALKKSLRRNEVRDDAREFIVARGKGRNDTDLVGRLLVELERVDSENRDLSHRLAQVREYAEREKTCSDELASELARMDAGAPLMREQAVSRYLDRVLRILGGVL